MGEPEIENLDRAGDVENDVGRLDIAVNDPFGVGEVQPGADVLEDEQPVRDRKRRSPPDQLVQCFARHVLHGDERLVVVLADIEDRHDVGMSKPPGRPSFAREPLSCGLVVESLLQ